MIHAVIADDEVRERHKSHQFLREDPEVEIVGESKTTSETIEIVGATMPEMIFLISRCPREIRCRSLPL